MMLLLKRALLLVLLVGLIAAAFGAPCRADGAKWALLVGIDDYENEEINDLHYAVADIKAVERTLKQHAGFAEENVVVMTSDVAQGPMRPTSVNIIKRLETLAQRIGPEDTFLFYFSGHGYIRPGGKHFLGAVNADPFSVGTLEASTVSFDILRERMKQIQARQVIFILDACRNDPEKARGDVDNLRTQEFSRDFQKVAGAAGGGQAATAVFFACSENERSYEWPEKRHGVFTYYLLSGLQTGRAAEPSGALTMTSLARYVQDEVRKWGVEYNKRQNPDLHQQGAAQIVLARVAGPVTPLPPTPAAIETVDTTAQIQIETTPSGATVFVDGVEQPQKTPCIVQVDLGVSRQQAVEIGLSLDGYKTAVRKVYLLRGSNALALNLQRPGSTPSDSSNGTTEADGRNTDDSADPVRRLENAVTRRPNDPEAWYNLGVARYNAGNFQQALTDFTRAIELRPPFMDAYYNRGGANFNLGNYADAVADYTKVLERKATDMDALASRAVAYMKLKDFDAAIADYDKVIAARPNPEAAYNRGLAHFGKKNYSQAVADFGQLIASRPNADAYYNRALAYALLNQHHEAIADLDKVIGIDSSRIDAYKVRALAHVTLGNYDTSIADYDRYLTARPNDVDALYNRGTAYYNRGAAALKAGNRLAAQTDLERAVTDYSAVLNIRPDDEDALLGRTRASQSLDKLKQ